MEATGATSPWYTFTTAAADSAPMDFLYFGDAQNGLDTEWKISANAARAAVPNAKLVLHGGDQINHADEDSEWHDWFASQGDLPATTATIAALGNHELSGDITAQAYRAHFTNPNNAPSPSIPAPSSRTTREFASSPSPPTASPSASSEPSSSAPWKPTRTSGQW